MISTCTLPSSTPQRFPELPVIHLKKKSADLRPRFSIFLDAFVSIATKPTSLSNYPASDEVNVEKAMKADSPIHVLKAGSL